MEGRIEERLTLGDSAHGADVLLDLDQRGG